ncbi:LexA family protein [Deinococcus sp. UYEF24]
MPPVLTPRRLELLGALHRLQRQGPVTVADLAAALKLSRTAIQLHLTALRTLGLISEATGRHGGMDLTDEGRLALRVGIPIYGQIAAGPPTLAEQQPDQVTPNMDTFLDVREGDFLLCVSGESMTGIGVMNGDHVLVRPTQEVRDGEVAVVLIPGENAATLKRIYWFGGEVTLISENPAYARMVYPADQVQVQGRMIARVGLATPRRRE